MGRKYPLIRLQRPDYLEDVMLALTQIGVSDPAVVDALGGQSRILSEAPVFSGLFTEEGRQEIHRLIFALVESEQAVDKMLRALADGGIDWEAERLGSILMVPVDRCEGTP